MGNYRYKTVLSNLLAPVAWLYLQPEAGLYFPGHRLGQAASGAEEKRQNG
jgi:hypothetical protein